MRVSKEANTIGFWQKVLDVGAANVWAQRGEPVHKLCELVFKFQNIPEEEFR